MTVGDLGVRGGAPHIGDRVVIGAGAKVVGPIDVGDDSRIGANAVVVNAVPRGHIAVGVPAVARPIEATDSTTLVRPCRKSGSAQE